MGLKEVLLATRAKFRREKVELSEGLSLLVDGQVFWVREMTAAERGAIENGRYRQKQTGEKVEHVLDLSSDRERVLVRCLCDEHGERLFADDDAIVISALPCELMDALYEAALNISGMGKRGGPEKNSPLRNGSLTVSPGNSESRMLTR